MLGLSVKSPRFYHSTVMFCKAVIAHWHVIGARCNVFSVFVLHIVTLAFAGTGF